MHRNEDDRIDERLAVALGIAPDADDHALAEALARHGERPLPRSPEATAVLARVARAADRVVRGRWGERMPSAHVAALVEGAAWPGLPLDVVRRAAPVLDLPEQGAIWRLAEEDVYCWLVDAGAVVPE
jgi:hypothetical protein